MRSGNKAAATLEISAMVLAMYRQRTSQIGKHFTAAGWEDADIVIDEATSFMAHAQLLYLP